MPSKTKTPPAESQARARINARPPTGKVAWPLVLIEGEEKAGKTWQTYLLSKSDKIGHAFAIDLGEGSADEYASIGNYQVLMADPDNDHAPWTFPALLEQVQAVRDFAREQLEAGEKPVLLTIDTMSDEWGVLVDAITAKAGESDNNRRKLADDPAAEIKVPNHLWNNANAKHRRLMTLLLTFPGIVVVTARGKEVAEIRNGAPVEGSKVWKVEGQKNLAYDATLWVRMRRNGVPTLEGARSVRIGLRPGVDAARDLPDEFTEGGLEWLLFDQYGLDPATAQVRDLRTMTDNGGALDDSQVPAQTLAQVYTRVQASWNNLNGLQVLYTELTGRGFKESIVVDQHGNEVPLGQMVIDRGVALAQEPTPDERQQATTAPQSDAEALAAAAASQSPAGEPQAAQEAAR